MFVFFEGLLEFATYAISIFLIIAGVSKKEKYSSAHYIRKRILILGIILLILVIIAGLPDMYHGFVEGYNYTRKTH